MGNILSERIVELRKERGLTQEQLGQLVGVSAQAVSKWEKGGAPDVELLPALADRLEVSIDALFGREGGETEDITQAAHRWMRTIPAGQRLDRLCRLIWDILRRIIQSEIYSDASDDIEDALDIKYLKRAEMTFSMNGEKLKTLPRARITLEEGIVMNLHADDFSFVTIWPEPEAGYEAFFAKNAVYRRLFETLSRPKCLELLEYLCSKPARYYVAEAVAKPLGLDLAEAEQLLNALKEIHLLHSLDLELENGVVKAYMTTYADAFIPFLYTARCLSEYSGLFINASARETPFLRGEKWKETEDKSKGRTD